MSSEFGFSLSLSSGEESDYSEARDDPIKMPTTPNTATPGPSNSQVNAVSIKLPPFWTRSPRIWFKKVECQFMLQGVTQENTKFAHVVSILSEELAEKVMDVIENPGEQPYATLKKALIEQFTLSEERRIHELLYDTEIGDRKPSELFKYMRSVAGNSEVYSDSFLITLWEGRLPTQISAILKVGNYPETKDRLSAADRIFEALKNVQVNEVQSSHNNKAYEKLVEENRYLRDEISELKVRFSRFDGTNSYQQSRDRNRNRSNSRNRRSEENPDFCYYHNTYGKKARKCRAPCKFKRNEQQGN